MRKHSIEIEVRGRCGSIIYWEQNDQSLEFSWEFGGGSAVAIIYVPLEEEFDTKYPWVSGRREEIVKSVLDEVILRKAPGCIPDFNPKESFATIRSKN